jgi:hypothetical protein
VVGKKNGLGMMMMSLWNKGGCDFLVFVFLNFLFCFFSFVRLCVSRFCFQIFYEDEIGHILDCVELIKIKWGNIYKRKGMGVLLALMFNSSVFVV